MTSPKGKRFIKKHIRHHIRDLGMKPKQAVAVAFVEAREKGFRVPKPNPHITRKQIRTILGPQMAGLGKDTARKLRKAFKMELR